VNWDHPAMEWESGLGDADVEHAGEYEAERFFSYLSALARRAKQSPMLRAAAQKLRTAGLIGRIASLATHPLPGDALPLDPPVVVEAPDSSRRPKGRQRPPDPEAAWENVDLSLSRIRVAALMEHLGSAAARAIAASEADALAAALVPLAFRWLPSERTVSARISPTLVRGVASIGRILGRRKTTRPLLRLLPSILRRTVATLARERQLGLSTTSIRAARILASEAAKIIDSPQRCVALYRRSRALHRYFHRNVARRMAGGSTDYAESEGIGFSVPCPFDSCAQTRDPDTGLITCVDRGCSNGCALRSTWLGAMCCCK
jgi:hypothetical protein